ncbi:site-specific integrase [Actinomadura harenae]|uniref:Site-specific integrase n=2 Tax=Actinomadura harenae TaxID=2483351 RepID=A0A3M2M2Y1_9ACTN|nr:site-specific integrase [Actinomadura harenae]
MRLIQPSLIGFRCHKFSTYASWFRQIAQDPRLEEFCERADRLPVSLARTARAVFDACCALTVLGINFEDLTPEAFMHYAAECRDRGLAGEGKSSGTFAGTLAWTVLHDMGQFPASAPRTLRAAVTRGQRPVEELLDRYHLQNQQVRNLLADYITRRAAELDYATTQQLVRLLGRVFWKTIEEINPDQADLRLSDDVVARWKEQVSVLPNGKPRLDLDGPLMAVRALYLDLHTWAVAEPERWAHWVAPCPVRNADLRWAQKRRRQINERMARRTRDRQPLLPILAQHVTDKWQRLRGLLDAAKDVELGQEFTVDGVRWRRASTKDQRHNRPPIHAINLDTGDLVRVTFEENLAFWEWAVIETLRLAGLRAEELTELSHLSIRQYRRVGGEVVALLVVSPSKSDRERVIPMSAELFHVIAQVIRRHRDEHGTVPVCSRYDLHEKVWSEDLPYLFQTVHSGAPRAISATTVWRVIRRPCQELAATRPEFQGIRFAPHDFRRLFATELVNNGLPIHIGAALLPVQPAFRPTDEQCGLGGDEEVVVRPSVDGRRRL